MNIVLPALVAAVASFVGAWLAARLALTRFYQEKIWERKVAAYSGIFDSLHDMNLWFIEHFEAEITNKELPQKMNIELGESYNKAKYTLLRKLDSEVWLLSSGCQSRIRKLLQDLGQRHEMWYEDVDFGSDAVRRAIDDLRKIVQQDLGLKEGWYPRSLQYLQKIRGNS